MWITKYFMTEANHSTAEIAEVTGIKYGAVYALNEREYRTLPVLCPAGICSLPIQGEPSVVLPLANGAVCAGAPVSAPPGLEPGEVRLYSAGGAEILLKNDGTILLNGTVIPAVNKEER